MIYARIPTYQPLTYMYMYMYPWAIMAYAIAAIQIKACGEKVIPSLNFPTYRRSGFEREILLIVHSKELQEKEYALNSTRDHMLCSSTIANMHAFSISCIFDLLACMYVPTAIDRQKWVFFDSSRQLSTCQPHSQPSAIVTRVVWYSINSTPHMQSYKPQLYTYDWGCSFLVRQFTIVRIAIWLIQHHS